MDNAVSFDRIYITGQVNRTVSLDRQDMSPGSQTADRQGCVTERIAEK